MSQLTLRDYQPSPTQYDLPQGQTQITVQAKITLSGNNSSDTLIIKFGQPNSTNWQLAGGTSFQDSVNEVGQQNISFPISFRLKPGRSRIPGEHFQVSTTASLQSKPNAVKVRIIQVDVS